MEIILGQIKVRSNFKSLTEKLIDLFKTRYSSFLCVSDALVLVVFVGRLSYSHNRDHLDQI